jgi:hypothetical protein
MEKFLDLVLFHFSPSVSIGSIPRTSADASLRRLRESDEQSGDVATVFAAPALKTISIHALGHGSDVRPMAEVRFLVDGRERGAANARFSGVAVIAILRDTTVHLDVGPSARHDDGTLRWDAEPASSGVTAP